MHSMTIRQASPPLAFIILDILIIFWIFGAKAEPVEFSLSMLFAIHKLSNEKVSIGVYLNPSATSLIACKFSFENPTIPTDSNAHPFPLLPLNLPEIYLTITLDQLQILTFQHRFQVDRQLWEQVIVSEKITELLLRNRPYLLD